MDQPKIERVLRLMMMLTANNRYSVEELRELDEYAESEVVEDMPRELTKADMQREQIIKALRRNGGSRRAAAVELFMSERTLYRKIKELNIEE